MSNFDLLALMAPAFVACLFMGLTHIPLGRMVLSRGIVFMDLAVAQAAGFGILMAHLFQAHMFFNAPMMLSAVTFASLCAIGLYQIRRFETEIQEGLIGCVFVILASLAILILSNDPHGLDALEALLAGQILMTSWEEVLSIVPCYLILLGVLFWVRDAGVGFYLVFAVAITLSVNLAGIYLVFASLIIPALVSYKKSWRIAVYVCLISIISGMLISTFSDFATGPVVVCAYAITGLIFAAAHRFFLQRRLD